jgi:hypothetical protein
MVMIDIQRFTMKNLIGNNNKYDNCSNVPSNSHSTKANCKILACSMARSNDSSIALYSTRKLCEDRRGFLDHLRPKIFLKNVSARFILVDCALREVLHMFGIVHIDVLTRYLFPYIKYFFNLGISNCRDAIDNRNNKLLQ